MFFIAGISSSSKDLSFSKSMVCPKCGRLGHFQVFMTYMYFSFFFIPLIQWRKKYYVKSSCCRGLFSISNELGKAIEQGETICLEEKDLFFEDTNCNSDFYCPNCGFEISPYFEYCPRCGKKL